MRRQATTERAAGSSRIERLDPFTLPLRFAEADEAADEKVRHVELHREGVVMRRALAGIKMAIALPVSAYRGVALRMQPATASSAAAIAVVLEHHDPALSLTLCRASSTRDIVADWQSWGRALGVTLLVAQSNGHLREPFTRIGAVPVESPVARRRRRSSMRGRRASMPLRRGRGSLSRTVEIHMGEREIIARN